MLVDVNTTHLMEGYRQMNREHAHLQQSRDATAIHSSEVDDITWTITLRMDVTLHPPVESLLPLGRREELRFLYWFP